MQYPSGAKITVWRGPWIDVLQSPLDHMVLTAYIDTAADSSCQKVCEHFYVDG